MGTIQYFFRLILPLCILPIVSGLKTNVTCKRENISKLFHEVFSISLLVNGTEVAMVDHHERETRKVPLQVSVNNVSGSVEGDRVYLDADLNLDCNLTDHLECQLYGFTVDTKEYKTVIFSPKSITFEAMVMNTNYNIGPKLTSYATGDTVQMQCSADVGSVKERWAVHAGGEALDYTANSSFTPSACSYHTTASFQYTFKSDGQVEFNCMYGNTEVGTFLLEAVDMHWILSLHLLLSSMLLVYCPFVLMPPLLCSCPACSRTYRNPNNKIFKFIRSGVSLLGSLGFIIWWTCIYSQYSHSKEIRAYATFAWIEGVFLLGYAVYRGLFFYLEKEDNWYGVNRAYNSRVTTSHGAVMTPIICWLMIRVPNHLPLNAIEVVFWIVAVISTLTFVFVSHRREHDDWKRNKSE